MKVTEVLEARSEAAVACVAAMAEVNLKDPALPGLAPVVASRCLDLPSPDFGSAAWRSLGVSIGIAMSAWMLPLLRQYLASAAWTAVPCGRATTYCAAIRYHHDSAHVRSRSKQEQFKLAKQLR